MTWLGVLVLAVVQGVAEFLPISSSGHLALIGTLFGFDGENNLSLEIVLHGGTLISIVIFYWIELIKFFKKEYWHLALMVIVGSIPAGIAGVGMKLTGLDKYIFDDLYVVGTGFLITGTILWFMRNSDNVPKAELADITIKQAVLIGLAQMFAILPGVSRSGSTIAAGIGVKLGRAPAAEFSFLLAIVAIGGALGLDLLDRIRDAVPEAQGEIKMLCVGFLVAGGVGYFALKTLIAILKKGRWRVFSYYLFALGLLTLVYRMMSGVNQ